MSENEKPSPHTQMVGSDAREIIARFIAEGWASSPTSGGLTADYYMGLGTPHTQADELISRLAALTTEGQP